MWEEMAFELERNGDRKNNESRKGNIYSSLSEITTSQRINTQTESHICLFQKLLFQSCRNSTFFDK